MWLRVDQNCVPDGIPNVGFCCMSKNIEVSSVMNRAEVVECLEWCRDHSVPIIRFISLLSRADGCRHYIRMIGSKRCLRNSRKDFRYFEKIAIPAYFLIRSCDLVLFLVRFPNFSQIDRNGDHEWIKGIFGLLRNWLVGKSRNAWCGATGIESLSSGYVNGLVLILIR
jgi:hypothetical protein